MCISVCFFYFGVLSPFMEAISLNRGEKKKNKPLQVFIFFILQVWLGLEISLGVLQARCWLMHLGIGGGGTLPDTSPAAEERYWGIIHFPPALSPHRQDEKGVGTVGPAFSSLDPPLVMKTRSCPALGHGSILPGSWGESLCQNQKTERNVLGSYCIRESGGKSGGKEVLWHLHDSGQ